VQAYSDEARRTSMLRSLATMRSERLTAVEGAEMRYRSEQALGAWEFQGSMRGIWRTSRA